MRIEIGHLSKRQLLSKGQNTPQAQQWVFNTVRKSRTRMPASAGLLKYVLVFSDNGRHTKLQKIYKKIKVKIIQV